MPFCHYLLQDGIFIIPVNFAVVGCSQCAASQHIGCYHLCDLSQVMGVWPCFVSCMMQQLVAHLWIVGSRTANVLLYSPERYVSWGINIAECLVAFFPVAFCSHFNFCMNVKKFANGNFSNDWLNQGFWAEMVCNIKWIILKFNVYCTFFGQQRDCMSLKLILY